MSSPPPAISSHRQICVWLWILVAGVCLISYGIKLWQEHAYRRSRAAWLEEQKEFVKRHEQFDRFLSEAFRNRSRFSRAELERLLNGGRPFQLRQHPNGYEVAVLRDPAHGAYCEFKFRGDEWIGVDHGPYSPPEPKRPSSNEVVELVRRSFAGHMGFGWGTATWLVVFLVCIASRKYRRVAAEAMLALTFLCGTAWLVSPNYSLTVQHILGNDSLVLVPPMLAVSITCLAFANRRKSKPMEPLCSICDYNLTGNVSGVCPECGSVVSEQGMRGG